MANEMVSAEIADLCSDLLEQSRMALTTLQAERLEELTKRAEHLLADAIVSNPVQSPVAGMQLYFAPELVRQRSLLGDLLHASSRNLQVLRTAHGDTKNCKRATRQLWVR